MTVELCATKNKSLWQGFFVRYGTHYIHKFINSHLFNRILHALIWSVVECVMAYVCKVRNFHLPLYKCRNKYIDKYLK